MQEWENTRDEAFHVVILTVTGGSKLYSYVLEHVPNLKAMRELDPTDILKVQGYGKKTADELRDFQERIHNYPKILTRLNKAIEMQRRMDGVMDEHKEVIGLYTRLKSEVNHTRNDLKSTWLYYGGPGIG
jgi:DNA repair protein RadC